MVIVWVSAFDFLRRVGGLAKKGFWDTYGMDIQFHTSLLVALGVTDHAEQHIQIWESGRYGIMMNIDLVVIFIVVE